jgi:hydroxyacylglutathione hydrolase
MTAHIRQFKCLDDNFGVLLHDSETGATAAIDVPEAGPVLAELAAARWNLTDILVTHRHKDHVGGIPEVKAKFPKARVVVPHAEADQIGAYDVKAREGDFIRVGGLEAKVIETPGHTVGHIVYWFEEENLLFAGDMLFAMGCGRVFETPADVMWNSLMKLAVLPGETQLYCGHEYTLANGRFALTIEPDNELLQERMKDVEAMRAVGKFTLPSTMALEYATNPFLRADEPSIRRTVGMPDADAAEVFAEVRARKNRG